MPLLALLGEFIHTLDEIRCGRAAIAELERAAVEGEQKAAEARARIAELSR
jgi:hypothetical protein